MQGNGIPQCVCPPPQSCGQGRGGKGRGRAVMKVGRVMQSLTLCRHGPGDTGLQQGWGLSPAPLRGTRKPHAEDAPLHSGRVPFPPSLFPLVPRVPPRHLLLPPRLCRRDSPCRG